MLNVLAISGSDSSGGAGMQCDIKTITAHGHNALSVVTSTTAQNSTGLHHVEHASPSSMAFQLESIFTELKVHAVKTGMIPNRESITHVCNTVLAYEVDAPYVLDPVLSTTSGSNLVEPGSVKSMIDMLFPLATLVTPNVAEAQILSGRTISSLEDSIDAARSILQYGSQFVLVKGGHLADFPGNDVLIGRYDSTNAEVIESSEYYPDRDVHGTGCALASAIACRLAKGWEVRDAVIRAKRYVTKAIASAQELAPGYWSLNHQASHTN